MCFVDLGIDIVGGGKGTVRYDDAGTPNPFLL